MDATPVQEKPAILFVDDEENVLRSLVRLFGDEAYRVFTAGSGRDGLAIVRENEVAVVISDQGMPEMRGTDFLAHVKELAPDTVRMVLTGYADINGAIDAINRGGAFQYVTKPWENDALLVSVRVAAERYALVKENRYLTELTRRQNEELKKWSAELETYVQQQTIDLTYKNKELVDTNEKLKRSFRDFTITISNLIELRDRAVANHSGNVATISREMAREMGLSAEESESIAIAAQLHDMGKIGVNDTILARSIDDLTPHELAEYRKHPIRGQTAMDSNEALTKAASIVRNHHEAFNGEGFPDGLKGDAIPIGSRMIAIADRYDRLLAKRPMEAALEEIRSLLGTRFDPELYYPLEKAVRLATAAPRFMSRQMEKELVPQDLTTGMVLSKDVRSGTGVLLACKGASLNGQKIDAIKRYFSIDPPDPRSVSVWIEAH